MNKTECKICYTDFDAVENYSICYECYKKILNLLGVELTDDFDVKDEDKEVLANFIYLVSKLGGLTDYLLHALDHHTHGTKTVNTVDVE